MANGLLDMFQNPQQSQMQALLGQYYDPRQAAKQQLWGMVRGLGQGLMNQQPSKTPINFGTTLGNAVQGGIEGSDQAVGDYQQKALLGYKMAGEKRDEDWQAKERARKESGWASDDANAAQVNALIGSIQDPQERLFAQLNPEAYVKSKLNPGGEGGGNFGTVIFGSDGNAYLAPKSGNTPTQLQFGEGVNPLNPYEKAYETSRGREAGSVRGGAEAELPGAAVGVKLTSAKIDKLMNNPSLESAIGYKSWLPDALVSNEVIDIRGKVKELLGGAFLEAYVSLKGAGPIAIVEGTKAEQAYQRMETALRAGDPKIFKEALLDFKTNIEAGYQKLQARAGQQGGVDTGTTIPDDPLGLR